MVGFAVIQPAEDKSRYAGYLELRARVGIRAEGLGDWYDIELGKPGAANLTPVPFTATAYYYLDVATLSQIARVIGRSGDADTYARKAAAIRERFNREFFDRAALSYGTGSQASMAIAVALGLADPAGPGRRAALDGLVRDLERRGYTTAGDVGFRSVLQALAADGRSDVVYRLIDRDDKPGYGYQIKKGETALAETWDAALNVSHNHFMLGQIIEWYYQDLAGIGAAPRQSCRAAHPSP